MSSIQKRIFEEMQELKIKQSDIAEVLGINKSVVSNWKRRDCDPAAEQITKICQKYKIDINYIMTGKKETKKSTTIDEQELIELYRASSDQDKDTIMKIATALSGGKVKETDIQEKSSNSMIG